MLSHLKPATNLEALLRATCRRAIGISFIDQIRLYRSIIALAREVRLRSGDASFDAATQTLSASLAEISEHASDLGLDPERPLPDARLLNRLATQLSKAARKAPGSEPADRKIYKLPPDLRDEPAGIDRSPQHPIQRETAADEGHLSAWRRDDKTARDLRAHGKRRTATEDRFYTKIKTTNQEERAEAA